MPMLVINFSDIQVHDDSDNWPSGQGELFWDLLISDTSISSRTRENPAGVDSGGHVLINQMRTLVRPDGDPNAFVKVSGWVSDQDDGLNFEDDHAGRFDHIFNQANGWGAGNQSVRLSGDSLDVTVNYTITVAQDGGL